jgi:hypothetical protein
MKLSMVCQIREKFSGNFQKSSCALHKNNCFSSSEENLGKRKLMSELKLVEEEPKLVNEEPLIRDTYFELLPYDFLQILRIYRENEPIETEVRLVNFVNEQLSFS